MRRTQHHLCSILVGNIQSESNQQEIPDNPKTRHVVLKKKRVGWRGGESFQAEEWQAKRNVGQLECWVTGLILSDLHTVKMTKMLFYLLWYQSWCCTCWFIYLWVFKVTDLIPYFLEAKSLLKGIPIASKKVLN